MIETYKMMNRIRIEKYQKTSNEDLAKMYIDEQNPSILAEMYCRNFKWWYNIASSYKYVNVPMQDKADICTTILHKAMMTYNGSTKFITYATIRICNNLYTLAMKYKNVCTYSLDKMREDMDGEDYEKNFDIPAYNEDLSAELQAEFKYANLSDNEIRMCNLLIENPNIKNSELSEILGVHRHSVRNMKLQLQTKLAFLRV